MAQKKRYPPPAKGPGGKALTKRERAEGIAKWAELLHSRGPQGATQTPGKNPTPAPAPGAATPANPPLDPLFAGSEFPEDKRRGKSKAKPPAKGKGPKGKPSKAPVSDDTGRDNRPKAKDLAEKPEQSDAAGRNNRPTPAGVVVDVTARPRSEPVPTPVQVGASNANDGGSSQAATPQPLPPTDPLMTPKQGRFVEEYLIDMNAAAAARRAGYSVATAKEMGYELLTKPHIQAAIAAKREELRERTQVTLEDITDELRKMGFANLADFHRLTSDGEPYIDLSTCTRDQMASLQELGVEDYMEGRGEDARMVKRVKVKLGEKRASLALLSDLLGYTPKKGIAVSGSLKVEKAEDSLAQTIRRMETEDLREYDRLATAQAALLAKVRVPEAEA